MTPQEPTDDRKSARSVLDGMDVLDQRVKVDRCESLLATGVSPLDALRSVVGTPLDALDMVRAVGAFSDAIDALDRSGQLEGKRLRDLRALAEYVDPEPPDDPGIREYVRLIADRLREVGVELQYPLDFD